MKQVKTKKQMKTAKWNKDRFGKVLVAGGLILTLLAVGGGTYAWYTGMEEISADREGVEVMTPYFLYLLNPGTTDSLQYTIGNIHPSETKQTVICVSNKKPDDVVDDSIDIARVSDFSYDLEFITTNNMEVTYDLYELEVHSIQPGETAPADAIFMQGITDKYWTKVGTALSGEDTTAERHADMFGTESPTGVVNSGTYTLYSKNSAGNDLHLVYSGDEYDYDYYLIEVNWVDENSFEKSLKETDVNYVVVNAKQPKPVEDTNIINEEISTQSNKDESEQSNKDDSEQSKEEDSEQIEE